MAEKKYLDDAGLDEISRHVNRRLKVVDVMPVSANNGAVRLYSGADDGSFLQGHIYKYENNEWTDITASAPAFDEDDFDTENNNVSLSTAQRSFTGTTDEWDALTTAEKQRYGVCNITDDESAGESVVDAVTDGDMHAATSNAVYDAVHSFGKKLLWSGTATKGGTVQFDSTGYDEVYAKLGVARIRAVSAERGANVRMKFIGQWCGADDVTAPIANYYRQDYLLDILSGGTVAVCGWLNKAGGGYTSETNLNVTEIWGIKYPTIDG